MTLLLGTLSAVFIGISDYLGGYSTRRSNAVTMVATAMIGGTILSLILTFVVDSEPVQRDLLLGAGSGLTMGFALMFLYAAIAASSAALASPIVSFFVVAVPIAWDLGTGGSVSGLAIAGAVLAVGGIVLTTFSPDDRGDVRRGVMLALVSGAFFGLGWTMVGRTSADSGMWSAFSQRSVAMVVMMLAASVRHVPRVLPRSLFPFGLASGIVGAGGVAAYIAATQRGSLTTAAVSSAMFPVVTVLLAVLIDREKLRAPQIAGIGLALVGIALIAAT